MTVEDTGLGGAGSASELPKSSNNNNNNNNNSNKNKVKFLCSHGGRILPGPGDGKLKYVGGETRAIVVPHDISFSELKKKLASISEGDTVLKYQLIPDDFEALISVKNDDDLRYMVNEYDRHSATSTKLRAFLFPSSPIIVENHTTPIDNHTRYVDAVNGIVRPGIIRAAVAGLRLSKIPRNSSSSLRASACTSPRSPDSCIGDFRFLLGNQDSSSAVPQRISSGGGGGMHRVHSSPTVSTLNQLSIQQQPNSNPAHSGYYCHHPQQQIHRLGHLSPTGTPTERLYSNRSMARSDNNYQLISATNSYCPLPVAKRGSMH